ncbi:DegV family protein [Adlercreutzia aquisgranensis]|uniref:DegV family protein n=1 Tax=Adlercreutzia aquisgranensis TaxID=2941323 RepID=UPI002040DCA9|nr:DegV family protein [Adlercreutzia aquisgranensis]
MIKIVTDSVASIPPSMAKRYDIDVVSLYVNRDGVEYEDATMDHEAFYSEIHEMADNIPTSSQPSQAAFEGLFERAAEAGDEVLGVFISSDMSGTYEGALRAARAVKARNIDFTYVMIDSTSNSFDEGWPVIDAAEARNRGSDLAECAAIVLEAIERCRFLFVPESLTFLQKGGRIGGAAALLGNLIKLVPVLSVADGQADTVAKVRSSKKAIERMTELFKADVREYGLAHAMVHYIGDPTPARRWAREVIEPLVGHAVEVLPVSPVIGLHVGPAVGIAYETLKAMPYKLSQPASLRMVAS